MFAHGRESANYVKESYASRRIGLIFEARAVPNVYVFMDGSYFNVSGKYGNDFFVELNSQAINYD